MIDFYSHASCEARRSPGTSPGNYLLFLLTRLLRGATEGHAIMPTDSQISTHTPLARRDQTGCGTDCRKMDFYSHASCEARRTQLQDHQSAHRISTHTPLARRDTEENMKGKRWNNFYSHASCEARPGSTTATSWHGRFLLTRLLRGATKVSGKRERT